LKEQIKKKLRSAVIEERKKLDEKLKDGDSKRAIEVKTLEEEKQKLANEMMQKIGTVCNEKAKLEEKLKDVEGKRVQEVKALEEEKKKLSNEMMQKIGTIFNEKVKVEKENEIVQAKLKKLVQVYSANEKQKKELATELEAMEKDFNAVTKERDNLEIQCSDLIKTMKGSLENLEKLKELGTKSKICKECPLCISKLALEQRAQVYSQG